MSSEIEGHHRKTRGRRDGPPRIPGQAGRGHRRDGRRRLAPAGLGGRRGSQVGQGRPAPRHGIRRVPGRGRNDAGLFGPAEGRQEAGRRRRHPREPRPQPQIEDIARRVALEGFRPSRPTPCRRSAERRPIPTRPGPSSRSSTARPTPRTSSRRSPTSRRGPRHRQGRLHGFLLGRRGDESGRGQRAGARGGRALLRHAAGGRGRARRSRRPCSSTTPATTSASTPASRPSRRRSRRPASTIRSTCTRARDTPS